MSFWDGTRWVSDVTTDRPTGRNRWRDWVATLAMVAVVLAFSLPFTGANATAPTMTLSPSEGSPGSNVVIRGQHFPRRLKVGLAWDGSTAGMPTATVTGRGSFRVSFIVPSGPLGAHSVSVFQLSTRRVVRAAGLAASGPADGPLLATTMFDVINVTAIQDPVATPKPTAVATPKPTAVATPKPTAVATPKPTAVATPKPTAVAAPTAKPAAPDPTPKPTPAKTPKPTPAPTPKSTTSGPIVVTTDGVTLDGLKITSSSAKGIGIYAKGTASNPVRNLTIRNCHIKGFHIAILAEHVENLVIKDCVIEDAAYGGIMVYSGVGGRLQGNTIRRIGYYTPLNTSTENNAYGIALSRYATSSFTQNPRSSQFDVTGNLVEDVPYWHCYDTHAGQGITFANNVARGCPRAFFITVDGIGTHPKNITVTSNRLEDALHVSGGTNITAVTLVNLERGEVTDNLVSTTYPKPWVYDYLGLDPSGSSNVTISGQRGIP